MADATERRFDSAGREIKSNRAWREEVEALRQQLAESQAFDTWKASPYTTVLEKSIAEDYVPKADIDSALMQAKRDGGREALLEAAVYADEQSNDAKYLIGDYAKGCSNEAASIAIKLRRMAEELAK